MLSSECNLSDLPHLNQSTPLIYSPVKLLFDICTQEKKNLRKSVRATHSFLIGLHTVALLMCSASLMFYRKLQFKWNLSNKYACKYGQKKTNACSSSIGCFDGVCMMKICAMNVPALQMLFLEFLSCFH